jgi:hypothetical protein
LPEIKVNFPYFCSYCLLALRKYIHALLGNVYIRLYSRWDLSDFSFASERRKFRKFGINLINLAEEIN